MWAYFVSIVCSSLDDFYIINFMFFLHFIPRCMCVCHMCFKVPTYLLAYLDRFSRFTRLANVHQSTCRNDIF